MTIDRKDLLKYKIAVTGAGGFIGNLLINRLQSLGASVFPIDGDVRNSQNWNHKFDILYHLAGLDLAKFRQDPYEAFTTNINGVLNALEASRKNNATIIFPSSCGVYEYVKDRTSKEEDPLCSHTSYSESKLIGERLIKTYVNNYSVRGVILRLFNVYGPGQREDFIIPRLIQCILNKKPAQINHINSSRDFIYISDVVDVLLLAACGDEKLSVFNVGSGKANSIKEVIDIFNTQTSNRLIYKEIDSDLDPLPWVCADIERIRNCLKWEPKVFLSQGIRKTLEYYSQQQDKDICLSK